jgi:hypothetical protein
MLSTFSGHLTADEAAHKDDEENLFPCLESNYSPSALSRHIE